MSPPSDRRAGRRIQSIGTATLHRASGEVARLAIRDLSTTGARLVGPTKAGEDELVRLSLELDCDPIWVTAQVVRTDPQHVQLAIEFRDATPVAARAIEQAIERAIARARARARSSVLVFHPDAEIRARLERDLSMLERSTTSCITLLEVVWSLHEPAEHDSVIVDADSPSIAELLAHLAEHAPSIRCVLLFSGQLRSIDHELSGHVSAVLRTPWRIRALARALDIDISDSSMALTPDQLGPDAD